jgi:hypothetical protein
VGLDLELAPLRRRRRRSRGRAAEGGGLRRGDRQGPRRRPLVRPGPLLAGDLSGAQGPGPARGRLAYIYGADWPGEARLAIETVQYGEADAYVLDVESELKNHPDIAESLAGRIREAVGPHYPLFYSTFAIARYHREFPFGAFQRHCSGALPLVYWNAFRWPVEQALGWTYEDYVALGEPPGRVFPVGGLYREGYVSYPAREEVLRFGALAASAGSPGISFWSYEHMDETMWQAVRDIPWPAEEDETAALRAQIAALQRQLDEMGRQNADFAGRIWRGSGLADELRKVLRGEP